MSNEPEILENTDRKRFELHIEDLIAFVEYIITKQQEMYLTHTEVPKELEGNGVGSLLISKVLPIIEERNFKLMPLCPFVASYIRRHPEWKRILVENINI